MTRWAALLLFATLSLWPAHGSSAPELYRLDVARSQVGFSFAFQGATQNGTMPVRSAVMRIDLDNVPASQVDVVLDASGARTGAIFVTQTMKGAQVLDTGRFRDIRFRSTAIRGDLRGADVTGALTIRDITRTVTLKAGLFRQRGTEIGSTDQLTVLLTGTISRAAFGAGGYPGFVGDRIDLRIIAQIEK